MRRIATGALLLSLSCIGYVLWQQVRSPSTVASTVTEESSLDVETSSIETEPGTTPAELPPEEESAVPVATSDPVSSTSSFVEEERIEDSNLDPLPTPAQPSVNLETAQKTNAELLSDRRALAESVAGLTAEEIPPETLEAIRNPSPELLDAIVEAYIRGELSEDFEDEFAVIDDWIQAPLFQFLEEADLLAIANVPREPLAEPGGYRDTTPQSLLGELQSFFRFELSTRQESPVTIYAVDPTAAVSGTFELNPDLEFNYDDVENINPVRFLDKGVYVDRGAPTEFTLMVYGNDFGVFPVNYTFYDEGVTESVSRQFMSTPGMLASATVTIEDNQLELYQWRIDYDGDGVVDFEVSHTGIEEEQAAEMVDFVASLDTVPDESLQLLRDNRAQVIEFLQESE